MARVIQERMSQMSSPTKAATRPVREMPPINSGIPQSFVLKRGFDMWLKLCCESFPLLLMGFSPGEPQVEASDQHHEGDDIEECP